MPFETIKQFGQAQEPATCRSTLSRLPLPFRHWTLPRRSIFVDGRASHSHLLHRTRIFIASYFVLRLELRNFSRQLRHQLHTPPRDVFCFLGSPGFCAHILDLSRKQSYSLQTFRKPSQLPASQALPLLNARATLQLHNSSTTSVQINRPFDLLILLIHFTQGRIRQPSLSRRRIRAPPFPNSHHSLDHSTCTTSHIEYGRRRSCSNVLQ